MLIKHSKINYYVQNNPLLFKGVDILVLTNVLITKLTKT